MKYRYYSILRPVSIGTFPKKENATIYNFDKKSYVPSIGRKAWGYVEYAAPLTENEWRQYDLIGIKIMSTDEVVNEYKQELYEISLQCAEEGYPATGSNYELRSENVWSDYYFNDYRRAYLLETKKQSLIKKAVVHGKTKSILRRRIDYKKAYFQKKEMAK